MNKLTIIILILWILSGKVFAQQNKAHLLQSLKSSQSDSAKIHILNDLGRYYKTRHHGRIVADLDSAKRFFLRAYELSRFIPDSSSLYMCQALMNLGELAIDHHDIAEGKAYFMRCVAMFQKEKNLEGEAGVYESLGYYLRDLTNDTMHVPDYYRSALAIYTKLKKTDKVIRMKFLLALDDYYLYKGDQGEGECKKLIEEYKNTRYHNLEMAYYLLANFNRYNGNLNTALAYALGGLNRMTVTNDTSKAEVIYGELAQVYQALGDCDNSIYYYKKTINLREKLSMRQQYIFRTAGFVIQQLIKQQKASEGLQYITDLEKRHPPDSEYETAIVAQVKAYCYESLGWTTKAENAYLLMMKGLREDKSIIGQIAVLDISKFYVSQNRFKEAASYIEKVKVDDALLSKDLELLHFKVDSSFGRFNSAINHFQRYKIINDSIFSIAKTKQVQELQIKYETEKKDKEIINFKSDKLIQKARVQRADNIRNITLAGIVVLTLFLAVLYKSYRFKQNKNKHLNLLVAEKDQLLCEKDALLLEKQWLLKEIHHRVKNNLAIVMGLLNRQSAYIDNEIALAAIQNSQNRMRSIALIHQKLYQSENLGLIAIPEYVEELILHLKDSFDLGSRIVFEKYLDNISLDVSQAVPLGLIINEAITNSIKYAYPEDRMGTIIIKLEQINEKKNLLQIKDNGLGFKKDFNANKANSLGMTLMRGLSKQLGGSFEITEEQGVLIKIVFKTETFIATSPANN